MGIMNWTWCSVTTKTLTRASRWHLSPTCGCATHQKENIGLIEVMGLAILPPSTQGRAQAGPRLSTWTWEYCGDLPPGLGRWFESCSPSHHRRSRGRSYCSWISWSNLCARARRCRVSTSEQQKDKLPLDALLRHFKCGEEAEIWCNKRRRQEAKRKTNGNTRTRRSRLYRFYMVDRLVNEGQEKVVVVDSLVWATVHGASRCRLYQGDLADPDFMRTVFRNITISMRSSTLRPTH